MFQKIEMMRSLTQCQQRELEEGLKGHSNILRQQSGIGFPLLPMCPVNCQHGISGMGT